MVEVMVRFVGSGIELDAVFTCPLKGHEVFCLCNPPDKNVYGTMSTSSTLDRVLRRRVNVSLGRLVGLVVLIFL